MSYPRRLITDPRPGVARTGNYSPMIVIYDDQEGAYIEAQEVCSAWEEGGEPGTLDGVCAYPAIRRAGDIPLCGIHYRRLMTWIAERDLRDHEAAMEREERRYEHSLEQLEEYHRREAELNRKWAEQRVGWHAPHSFVYCIRRASDGMVKIGMSGALQHRMATLRKEHGPIQVLLVLEGSRKQEGDLHNDFRSYRIGRTEWFRPVRPLLEWAYRARKSGRYDDIQPAKIMDLADLGRLVRAAPRRKDLHWEGGVLVWPPEAAA